MFRNYLTIAIRHLLRHKGYSLINIVGLAIGIALFLLVMLFVRNELSYDRFNQKIDRIYRLEFGDWAFLGNIYADLIEQELPEVQRAVRFAFSGSPIIKYKENRIRIDHFVYADPSVFDVFTFPFVQGNPETALKNPFSLVLTQSMAIAIFGSENPVGKIIRYNNQYDFTVTGIIQDVKSAHLTISALAPLESRKIISGNQDYFKEWGNWSHMTYLLVPENHSQKELEKKINHFFKSTPNWRDSEPKFHLRPLQGLYFASNIKYDWVCKHGNLQLVYMLITASLLILCIACINFINLSTARASLRAKEVGVRKVVGSQREQLIVQFLSESILISLLASVLALAFMEFLVPSFNNLASTDLAIHYTVPFLLLLFCGAIAVGIIAGLYPAFYLTSFRPVAVLRGEKTKSQRGALSRRTLIVLQFSISIALVIGTLIVHEQLDFMKNKKLGFDKEQLLYLHLTDSIQNRFDVFKERLLRYPDIKKVSRSSAVPGQVAWFESWNIGGEDKQFAFMTIDPDYLNIMGLELKEGRDFSWDTRTDESSSFLLNETAASCFGWKSPLGIERELGIYGRGQIIGVVKDFHFNSLHSKITPLVLGWKSSRNTMVSIKISSAGIDKTTDYIRKTWEEFSPEIPFEYGFLDESFDGLYKSEERLGRVCGSSSLSAIFIACLGLLGLASFTTEQRTKEIGIRKVLGASVTSIVLLLSKEFAKLVLVANVIAWPIAYYAMNRWLQDFAYRIEIGLGTFVLGGVLALGIALLTVSAQAIKAALANPVEALRYE